MAVTFVKGGRVVTPAGVLDDAWLKVEGDRISEIGRGAAPAPTIDLGGEWVLPGFIDLHVHGGGGHDVAESAADMAAAVAYHRRHGTTRTLVSLNAAPPDALAQELRWVAQMVVEGGQGDGHVIGAHLEGPFLSEVRRGAQNPAHLLMPDREYFRRAHRGRRRDVTHCDDRARVARRARCYRRRAGRRSRRSHWPHRRHVRRSQCSH